MPAVFDQDGTFIRTVGRRGDGPGEFRSPKYLWTLPGDSVLVGDQLSMDLFNPDLEFVRTIRDPFFGSRDLVVLDWPSNVVINALDPRGPFFGLPFHAVRFSGSSAEVVRSFGETGEVVTQSSMYYLMPHDVVKSVSEGYWSLAASIYDITKWSASHQAEFTLERRPPWFAERSDMGGGGLNVPPRPRCQGLTEDEAGLLWAFCLTGSPTYMDAFSRATKSLEEARASGAEHVGIPAGAIDYHLMRDTRIEVIDPRAKGVVASYYLDAMLTSVLPGRRAAVLVFSPEGVPYVNIYRFTVRR